MGPIDIADSRRATDGLDPSLLRSREPFLDVVRAVAIVRVVLWHTWSWAWLSWIPAMPAMFFTVGALLELSLDRRGWSPTVVQRLRRLMPPFWLYSAASVATMFLLGWRPGALQLVGWVVPLVDPVGDRSTPGLWIPLWYLRAYLWFVLASPALRWLARKYGFASLGFAAAAALAAWGIGRAGISLPAGVDDFIAYGVFVLGGMVFRLYGPPRRRQAFLLSGVAATVAVVWWRQLGPDDGVVNRSLMLTMLVGSAGIFLAMAFRDQMWGLRGRPAAIVDLVGRRALTIYLWQGFGLVAADRLVDSRLDPGPARATLALLVVAGVIAAAVILFGPVEDWAAGRAPAAVGRRQLAAVVPGAAAMVAALVFPQPLMTQGLTRVPLSGRAVVTRAAAVDDYLTSAPAAPGKPPSAGDREQWLADAMDDWVANNRQLVKRVGMTTLEGGFVAGDGMPYTLRWESGRTRVAKVDETTMQHDVAWWSMTKALTAVWLMRAVEAGEVSLDDKLSRWVPQVPNADRITLEQLARHTSGIPSKLDSGLADAAPDKAIARYRRNPRLSATPGSKFEYSRLGYFLLALAVERATDTPWRTAMEDLARRAGADISFDEDRSPLGRVTDPDERGYRGGLWAAGGIVSSPISGAQVFGWAFTDGLSQESREKMATFSVRRDHSFYGIALTPLCPCTQSGSVLRAERFGLDAMPGSFLVDSATGATAMIAPSSWLDGDSLAQEFYALQSSLLDALR